LNVIATLTRESTELSSDLLQLGKGGNESSLIKIRRDLRKFPYEKEYFILASKIRLDLSKKEDHWLEEINRWKFISY